MTSQLSQNFLLEVAYVFRFSYIDVTDYLDLLFMQDARNSVIESFISEI